MSEGAVDVNIIPIVAIAGAFVVAICCSAIYYAYLKSELVDQGLV